MLRCLLAAYLCLDARQSRLHAAAFKAGQYACVFCGSAADIISAVTFDHTGQHLATGDRGGRVVLFERVPTQAVRFLPNLAMLAASNKAEQRHQLA